MTRIELGIGLLGMLALAAMACTAADGGADEEQDTDSIDTDSTVDAGGDSDSDADTDADSDGDSDSDSDADAGIIEMDCSGCPAVGGTMQNMICALDICDEEVLVSQQYTSPFEFTGCTLEDTYEAVEHFGDVTNGLGAQLNGSYALMATGPATGTSHSTACDDYSVVMTDPWTDEEYDIHDVVEWRMILRAPDDAEAIRFRYVFFSEEYDDYISTSYNDRFYAIIESGSTNDGNPTIINFTLCREPGEYFDFICEEDDIACEEDEVYCYIAINTALSDCCWYNGCPDGYSWDVGTDISGTGYECSGTTADSSEYGSSTGWLQTSWPVVGGETFALTFHIHDTSDGIFDSEVILDSFVFLETPEQGTIIVE